MFTVKGHPAAAFMHGWLRGVARHARPAKLWSLTFVMYKGERRRSRASFSALWRIEYEGSGLQTGGGPR